MRIIDFFMWTFILVCSMLIIILIVNPATVTVITDKLKPVPQTTASVVSKEQTEQYSYVSVMPNPWFERCSVVEMQGEIQGITNPKRTVCEFECGEKSMDYYSNQCSKDVLTCYCKNS